MKQTDVNYSVELLNRDSQERTHIKNELLRLKSSYNITGKTVLELGCGLGNNLTIFKEDNRVYGVEGLEDAVAIACASGLNVVQANLEQPLPLVTASQDWVLCLDVLEHLVNPLNVLLEIHRILKPDGHAILNVPNHFNYSGRIKILFGSDLDVHNYFPGNNEWDNPHLRFFTYKGFARFVEVAGFRIEEDCSTNFGYFPGQGKLARFGLKFISNTMIRRYPELFVAGFFLVLNKLSKS